MKRYWAESIFAAGVAFLLSQAISFSAQGDRVAYTTRPMHDRLSTTLHQRISTHTGNTSNPHSTTYFQVGARDRSGLENRTDNFISYSTSRRFQIRPTGSTFLSWEDGKPYYLGAASVTIPATVGLHFIYFQNATLTSSTSPWDLTATIAPVATVYYDGTNGAASDERHSADRDRKLHSMLHSTVGARFASGLAGMFATGSISIGDGVIWDEDLRHSITAQSSVRVWYRSGSAMVFVEGVTTPYYAPAGALQYDNAGTLTATGAARYVCNYIYATNEITYPIALVVGQSQHATLASARAESLPTFPNMATREWKLIYRVIAQTGPTYIESADYRESSSLPGGSISSLPASSVTFTATGGITETNTQSAVAGLDTRFTNYTGNDRVAYADSIPTMVSHGGAMAMIASHPTSVSPFGGHPAAGGHKQEQYNLSGTPAGAIYSRYSDSTKINQAASRYAHSHEWRGENNELQAYMLGHGAMVFGTPYSDAFIVTGWSAISNFPVIAADAYALGFRPTIYAIVSHSVDNATLIKNVSLLFRNFTSFDVKDFGFMFAARRYPPEHTRVRIVLKNTIRDIDGNYLYNNYSSPFLLYSTAGI